MLPEDPNYLPLYLDNDAVMSLFKMGNYRSALRREAPIGPPDAPIGRTPQWLVDRHRRPFVASSA
ncbi:hypothetical protein [Streptomyces sp. Ag109_G2-15]|uniref:hypothetical protein n=1 Tax=Streptomyces sp. Ag109_G2-15 TaxID=1938850 RepID=UPI000BD5DCDE|nr:hypothetical protein [Streptomyces sp. Ag109_G2-15]SOD84575.1 hypothetical protein SAMN06272765_1961 [Streptomyces sp. Ag109_G2-15]